METEAAERVVLTVKVVAVSGQGLGSTEAAAEATMAAEESWAVESVPCPAGMAAKRAVEARAVVCPEAAMAQVVAAAAEAEPAGAETASEARVQWREARAAVPVVAG